MVLFYEDRLPELAGLDPAHFSSDRARVFRILRRRIAAAEPVDFLTALPELRAAGVALTAINCVAWWLEGAPGGLAQLRQRLCERRARRTIHALASQLLAVVRDENRHVDDVLGIARDIAAQLRRVTDAVTSTAADASAVDVTSMHC